MPSTAVLLGVPGPNDDGPRMMLLHDDRRAVLHDLTTGAELSSVSFPPANYGPENPTVSGGLLLLRHVGKGGSEVTAYDPITLRIVWNRQVGRAYEVSACGAVACLSGPDGVRGIDPATGTRLWYSPTWRAVEERNGMLVAYGSEAGVADPVGLIDARSGRVLTGLSGWRMVGGNGGDHLLVTKEVDEGARTIVAIAGPRTRTPQPLADLPPGTGDCQSVPSRLVCRSTTGELLVWSYRKD